MIDEQEPSKMTYLAASRQPCDVNGCFSRKADVLWPIRTVDKAAFLSILTSHTCTLDNSSNHVEEAW